MDSDTFPLDDSSGTLVTSGCAYGSQRTTHGTVVSNAAYVPHIAEGVGAAAHNEFLCTNDQQATYDLMEPPTAIIHGIAALPSDVAPMRTDRTRLVWSPRSNIDLYGNTAAVTMYDALGVPISLGTDWIASGSMNLLRELKCADSLNAGYFAKHFRTAISGAWSRTTRRGRRAWAIASAR